MRTQFIFILSCCIAITLLIVIGSCNCKSERKGSPVHKKEDKLNEHAPDTIIEADAGETRRNKKQSHVPLTLIVKNLASPTAPVVVGIYNSQHRFLYKEGRLKEYTFTPKGNTLTALITDINYSEMAVAVYQDMNSNGKFDKNSLGLPKEGYAFSNNFKPRVKAPEYDDCKFRYDSLTHTVITSLIK